MRSAITPHLLERVHKHPFNVALCNGTLPMGEFEKFKQQDRLYLKDYSYAFKHLAPRLTNPAHQELCNELSKYVFKEVPFLDKNPSMFFQPTPYATFKSLPVSNYTRFFLYNAKNKPVGIALASLLPCFYLYSELGKRMNAEVQPNNPYYKWIKSYSSDIFLIHTQRLIEMFNELGDENFSREEEIMMTEAFIQGTMFELALWDSVQSAPRTSQLSTNFS